MNEINKSSQLKSMPEYQCHKRVRAGKITGIKTQGHQRFISFIPDPKWSSGCRWCDEDVTRVQANNRFGNGSSRDHGSVACTNPEFMPGGKAMWIEFGPGWMDQYKPQIGGYVVRYEDGYQSYSPAKAFEEGYTMVPVQGNGGGNSVNSGELDQRDRTMNEKNDSACAIKARLDEIKQKITNTGNTQLTPSIAELVRDSTYELISKLKKYGYDDVSGYVKCTVENHDGRLLNSCLGAVRYERDVIRLGVADLPVGSKTENKFTDVLVNKPIVDKPTVGRIVHYNQDGYALPAMILYVNQSNGSCMLLVHGIAEDRRIDYVRQGTASGQWKWPDRA